MVLYVLSLNRLHFPMVQGPHRADHGSGAPSIMGSWEDGMGSPSSGHGDVLPGLVNIEKNY